jgi:hypothetical protein
MTDKIDDGGAAFPVPDVFRPDGHHAMAGWYGMSLRDWFAGQALAGLLADDLRNWTDWPDHPAIEAYKMADAMLTARKWRDNK